MKLSRLVKYIHFIPILSILVLSAYLRLYRISEYMTFLGDEGRDVLVVKRMIVDGHIPFLGPTASVGGFYLGPVYYYFMAPFLWLWNLDPTGPAVMVALVGIVTVYLIYKMGSDMFDERVGLVAASIYGLSPVVIAMSRSSWNPNIVPFFSTLLVYLLWKSVAYGRGKLLFWVGFALGIGIQLHYLFLFLFVLVFAWYILFGRSRSQVKYYLLGIAGVIVGFAPFLAFELVKGFPNTHTIIRYLSEGKDTGFDLWQFLYNINDVTFRLFGRLVFRLPQPERWKIAPLGQITSWLVSIRTAIGVGLGTLAYWVVTAKRSREGHVSREVRNQYLGSAMLLLWYVVITMLFGFYKKGIYDYYLGIYFALPFLLVGIIVWQLMRYRVGKVLGIAIWIGIVILNWQGRPFLYPPNNQLAQAKLIAQAAYEKADGAPFNFALVTDHNSDHAYRYFFEIWGNKPVTLENEANDPTRKTITDQLIVICENSACQPLGHPLWEIAGFGPAEVAGSWDVSFVRIYKLVHYQAAAAGKATP